MDNTHCSFFNLGEDFFLTSKLHILLFFLEIVKFSAANKKNYFKNKRIKFIERSLFYLKFFKALKIVVICL